MKYRDIVSELSENGSSEAENETLILISSLFGKTKAHILANQEDEYDSDLLKDAISRRKNHEPLQYILGKWQFMGIEFEVNSNCLIPRQDTEILVENAVKDAKSGYSIADLCCGSGCIGLSLLHLRKDISDLLLVDVSENALNVAKDNSEKLHLNDKCDFLCSDIKFGIGKRQFNMILSNPPYIPTYDIQNLSEEVKKEPYIALDGGKDGLDFIRVLFNIFLINLLPGGEMIIEFGFGQKELLEPLVNEFFSSDTLKGYKFIKDYSGNYRNLILYRK